ncbi:recombination regulator RecX [Novilysobacter erysipheiresistens]|uniref:Regulatory protein RecX n=1 Tax=Novilysobacter erysipheiresistens TaxID=1749332 RepID=A0ABU7YV15_9GAMM
MAIDDAPDDDGLPGGDTGGLFGPDGAAGSRRRRQRPVASTTQRALTLLVRREHSRKELTRKLVTRGLDPVDVDEAVAKLADAGWQDDRRFAESLVRSRVSGGYGPIHIRAELGTHGLDSDAIAAALDSFDGDWVENARDLIRRRFGEAASDDLARRRKATDLLMRRGFPGDVIRAATRFDPDD